MISWQVMWDHPGDPLVSAWGLWDALVTLSAFPLHSSTFLEASLANRVAGFAKGFPGYYPGVSLECSRSVSR